MYLSVDPCTLATEDPPLLARCWDEAIVPALEEAARRVREDQEPAQLAAFLELERSGHASHRSRLRDELHRQERLQDETEHRLQHVARETRDARRLLRSMESFSDESIREAARERWSTIWHDARLIVQATTPPEELGELSEDRTPEMREAAS